MPVIKKTETVDFSAEQMYQLVNDVDSYPRFLPWCKSSSVSFRSDDRLTASLTLEAGKIKQTFATENTMQPGRRIEVRLLSGPFKYLEGHWLFEPVTDSSCRISLEMDFEFKSKLLKLSLSNVFNHIIGSLVHAFTRRAEDIYG